MRLLAAGLACAPALAAAQVDSPAPTATITLPTVEVIAPTPLLGSGVERAKVPGQSTVLTSGDISRSGIPNMLGSLDELAPGVSLSGTAGNPFQPALVYRGFQASPLQGNAQGLAVYVDGARFNHPFGDTVDWDLIPDLAIDRVNLEGSNPVFGLNALGGSLSVQLKNGFSHQGGDLTVFGGSFGTYAGEMQYGVRSGNMAAYTAARWLHQDGWRVPQSSDLADVFGTLGWRGNGGKLNIDLITADTRLNGPGSSPVEQIEADPSATFTGPALLTNKYARININGSYDVSDKTSLQEVLYYDYLRQKYANGAVADFERCDNGAFRAFLCRNGSDVLLTDRSGNPIDAFLGPGPYSQLNLQSINTNGYGATLQIANRTPLWGHGNQLIAGISFDGAQTLFAASAQAGGFDPATSLWFGPGATIVQADGSLAPDRVQISTAYYGAFLTDTFDITPSLSASVAGRFNFARIDLSDKLGTALSGNHTFRRLNPAFGLTYKPRPGLSVYASYAEANRAPMPVELTCASPTSPCSLSNFLAADPDLKQVVSHTVEVGVRAETQPFPAVPDAKLASELALYRTTLSNDIHAVGSGLPGLQFFQNVGSTLRQGIDLKLRLAWERLTAYLAYSYIDAEFQTGFIEQNPDNPGADANGNIFIKAGDRIPNIPAHILKFGADYKLSDKWTIGGSALAASGRVLFGDEANLTPRTPPYFVLTLHSSYWLASNVQVFALINNAFNARYYTFGTFGPTAALPIAQAPGAANPRQYTVAAPIGAKLGVQVTF
jgi:outer membrane receptor protein involved in Fe transport